MPVARDRLELKLQHAADSRVRVVSLLGRHDLLARMYAARDPQRFEIRDCAAAAEMPEMIFPAEHGRQFADGFLLHRRAGAASVERVIIWIDPHRQRVGEPRHRMRRFQHLPGVERMKIRIVIAQPRGGLRKDIGDALAAGNGLLECRQIREARIKPLDGGEKFLQRILLEHDSAASRAETDLTPAPRRASL